MEEKQVKFKWQRDRTSGKGSYGFVSLASIDTPSPMIPSLIAIKSCMLNCSPSLRNEREFLRVFEDCPQIIRCFGFNVTYEDDLYLYNLPLKFASTGSLADRLSLIHKKGIIHCDIKPQNILLTTDDGDDGMAEVAKIADFGLSITLEQNWKVNVGNPSARWSADMLFNLSFLKSADDVQPPDTKKRLCDGMSLLLLGYEG
ncbi:hypothetical protein KY284_015645 [Solanum tuberosum]|nr:hypothetical protein KY284_015645 [Solanum tuberosum]